MPKDPPDRNTSNADRDFVLTIVVICIMALVFLVPTIATFILMGC